MSENKQDNPYLRPDWVLDAQRVSENWFNQDNKEAWLGSKSITFDKEAQDNLPQHIKDKMKRHIKMASEKCKCTPDETTGWIEEAGHKCCNICGQTQGLINKTSI